MVFWVGMPFISEISRRIGGTYHLSLHGRRVSRAGVKLSQLSFNHDDRGLPKRRAGSLHVTWRYNPEDRTLRHCYKQITTFYTGPLTSRGEAAESIERCVKIVGLLFRIREMPGSNLVIKTCYPKSGFTCFSHSVKAVPKLALKLATIASTFFPIHQSPSHYMFYPTQRNLSRA
jgi:hypothetical protein